MKPTTRISETLCALFERRVRAAPGAPAVSADGGEDMSYRLLDVTASRVACRLRALGVGRDTPVALLMTRGVDLVVAVVAIVKAGGAYMPIPADFPDSQIRMMCSAADPILVIADSKRLSRASGFARAVALSELMTPDGDGGAIADESRPDDLAYIAFTSGSTGTPKGAQIPISAVTNLVVDTNYVEFSPNSVVGQLSNPGFDAFTFELWGALLNGCHLHVLDHRMLAAAAPRLRSVAASRPTVLFLTTSVFHRLARAAPHSLAGLDTLVFGGEVADAQVVREFALRRLVGRLVNGYGPTETTTFCAAWQVDAARLTTDDRTIPVGAAIAGATLHVLDAAGNDAAVGSTGQVCVGGMGLARGYVGDPELTAARFVNVPGRGRLYLTGDLGRRLPDDPALIEVLGRLDDQVKVRGYRVEPGEVEAVLRRHASVDDAAVVPTRDARGDTTLVAYIVPGARQTVDRSALAAYLADHLPAFMVPAKYTAVRSLPLDRNGKVDRKALRSVTDLGGEDP